MPCLSRVQTALAVALLSVGACAPHRYHPYASAESPLQLDRVVLYRNGVGYFERTGKLDGDLLTLKVRKDQVNDLLKSLTIVDRASGRAVSVSMPLDPQTWANAALATLRPGQGSLAEVLDALRGSAVTLTTTAGTVRGRIALVEQLRAQPAASGQQPAKVGDPCPPGSAAGWQCGSVDFRVSLLDGDQMNEVLLSTVQSVRLDDGDLAMQFNRTLDASAGEGMFQQVAVSIRLGGTRAHDLLVSYVVAAPMWKPTYRVVLPKDPKGHALLQAWAVVDNTSGEEWKAVNLALTSGAPIAFRYDLHTPRIVERPDLTSRGELRQADAMVGETTFGGAPPPPPADISEEERDVDFDRPTGSMAPASPAPMPPKAKRSEDSRFRKQNMTSPTEQGISIEQLRRTTQAQTTAATAAGQTRFELGERVTVPEGTSTMVAIINAEVDGEETFLFRPGAGGGAGYETNPYRVVRFKNSTPFVLEPGPIGIYAGGSFVGEGLSDTVGAGTSATIPFAVEPGVMVTSTVKDDADELRLLKLSRGVLEVEQFARRTTIYTAKAQTLADGFTVLVRHPRTGGIGSSYTLATRPEGTEDLPDAYLVRLAVAKGSKQGTVTVVEQTPSRSELSIWDEPSLPLLEKLIVRTDLDPALLKQLRPIVDKRRELGKLEEQIAGLTDRRDKLDQRSHELRANLEAIAKNPQAAAQRAKWAKQLEDFTNEGNKLGVQLADLEAKRLDRRTELEDALGELELVLPVAKP